MIYPKLRVTLIARSSSRILRDSTSWHLSRTKDAERKHFSDESKNTYDPVAAARTLKLLKRTKVTTRDIGILKRKKKPITMVTAYDYPSAVHVDLAGFDILLVGDSVGMVELVRCGISCSYRHNNDDLAGDGYDDSCNSRRYNISHKSS
jgi:hypothetical protein